MHAYTQHLRRRVTRSASIASRTLSSEPHRTWVKLVRVLFRSVPLLPAYKVSMQPSVPVLHPRSLFPSPSPVPVIYLTDEQHVTFPLSRGQGSTPEVVRMVFSVIYAIKLYTSLPTSIGSRGTMREVFRVVRRVTLARLWALPRCKTLTTDVTAEGDILHVLRHKSCSSSSFSGSRGSCDVIHRGKARLWGSK